MLTPMTEHPRWISGAVFALILLSAGSVPAQDAGAKPPVMSASANAVRPPPAGYAFPDGVTYHYKAEYRLLTAGVASIHIERGAAGVQRVTGIADATGLVARLYHVHDVFQSEFGEATFCSQGLSKYTEEGHRRHEAKLHFHYPKHKAVQDEVDLKSGERKHKENAIPDCVLDVLTGLIYAASLPLTPGATYAYPINDGGKTVDLKLSVGAREQIRTGAGTFDTVRVQPNADLEIMKNRGKVWFWFSDDARNIPVQIRGKLGWGTLTLSLESVEPAAARR